MIYLARHGETDWNLFKRANGITETFLNQTGLDQAKAMAKEFENIDFDVCFCSTQIRARQFCDIVCKKNVDTIYDKKLVEILCGEFEGVEETADVMNELLETIKIGDKGTESLENFMKRTCDICDIITEKYKGKNVLIISHAINIRVINWYFTGKPPKCDIKNRIINKGEFITYEN